MFMKKLNKQIRQKIVAVFLATTVAVSSVNVPVRASSVVDTIKQCNFDPVIIEEVQKMCTNGERAVDVLNTLYERGLVDEKGMPIVGGTFVVDGKEMTEEQLIEEANKHKFGLVNIDGTQLKWADVNQLFQAKKAIKEIYDFMNTDVTINDSNKEAYQESLNSLQAQLQSTGMQLVGNAQPTVFGSGIRHDVKVDVTAETSLKEIGEDQDIKINIKLSSAQTVPVTFDYRAVSGSGEATGNGTITVEPGQTEAHFQVTYKGNSDGLDGERVFYVQCYNIKNALFSGEEANGRSCSLKFSARKSDLVYSHNVSIDGSMEDKAIIMGSRDIPLTYSCNYDRIKEYLDEWGTNNFQLQVKDPYIQIKEKDNKDYTFDIKENKIVIQTGKGEEKKELSLKEDINETQQEKELQSDGYRIRFYKIIPDEEVNLGKREKSEIISIDWSLLFNFNIEWSLDSWLSFNDSVYSLPKVALNIKQVHDKVSLSGISIPNGTFYAGQLIPIVVTFDEKVKLDNTLTLVLNDNTKLEPVETGTSSNKCTFLYQVPDNANGEIPAISSLEMNGTKSFSDDTLEILGNNSTTFDLKKAEKDYPDKIVLSNNECQCCYYKESSFNNVAGEIDDNAATEQWITEVLFVGQDENEVSKIWIQNNCAPIDSLDLKNRKDLKSGLEVQEALVNTEFSLYSDSTQYQISEYVKSTYLSMDGGKTRIPFYVVMKSGKDTESNEDPVALVAHFKPDINYTGTQDINYAELFMDPKIDSTYDYIKNEEEAQLMISETQLMSSEAQVKVPAIFGYSIKPAIFTYPGAASINYTANKLFKKGWTDLTDDINNLVTYHQPYIENSLEVVTSQKVNPVYVDNTEEQNQYVSTNKKIDGKPVLVTLREETQDSPSITSTCYDVENTFITNPFRVEDEELSLTAEFDDKDFTFYGTDNLVWVSSDETVATVQYPEKYIGKDAALYGKDKKAAVRIIPTGKTGSVYFTLYALNNGIEGFQPVEVCRSVTLHCEAGKNPFIKVPCTSDVEPTLRCEKGKKFDICFSSNITNINEKEARALNLCDQYKEGEFPTDIYIKVYETDEYGKSVGKPVYENEEISTVKDTIGKLEIPENILNRITDNDVPQYVAVIGAKMLCSELQDGELKPGYNSVETRVGIFVLPGNPSVSFEKMESYSVLDSNEIAIHCNLSTEGCALKNTGITITDSEGVEVYHAPIEPGDNVFNWKPEPISNTLKKTYVVKASVTSQDQDTPSTDSFVLAVYNHNALDILVDAVKGRNQPGVTDKNIVELDNHNKIISLLNSDKKTIQLGKDEISLESLSRDINLSSMISINYGDYVWGKITDQIKWEVMEKDSKNKEEMNTPTTMNFSDGGTYSNIKANNYVSYSPSDNFMIVGHDDGETIIKATQVRTGMSSEIQVSSCTLENQLYLFKFLPSVKTTISYTDGKGKECQVKSDDNGELALYEENGIASDVVCISDNDDESYIGTIRNYELMTGEQNISKLQYYPVNNATLLNVCKAQVYVKDEQGNAYSNKDIWVRGGVLKNDKYCYAAQLGKDSKKLGDGKQEQVFHTDDKGIVTVYFDSTQFYTEDEKTRTDQYITADDDLIYMFEFKYQNDNEQIQDGQKIYEPQIVRINTDTDGSQLARNCQTSISLEEAKNGYFQPVICSQYFKQYEIGTHNLADYTNVYHNTGSIGISHTYPEAVLETEMLFWGQKLETESLKFKDTSVDYGKGAVKLDNTDYEVFYQDEHEYEMVNQESIVENYPFLDMPLVKNTWKMNKNEIKDWLENGKTTAVNIVSKKSQVTYKQMSNSFTISNTSETEPIQEASVDKNVKSITEKLSEGCHLGLIGLDGAFDGVTEGVGTFINNFEIGTGTPVNVRFTLTPDPNVFHAVIKIGEASSTGEADVEAEKYETEDAGSSTDIMNGKWKKEKEEKPIKKSKTANGGNYTTQYDDAKNDGAKEGSKLKRCNCMKEKKEEEEKELFKKKVGPFELTYGGYIMVNVVLGKDGDWDFEIKGGGLSGALGYEKELLAGTIMVGPVPFCYNIKLAGAFGLDFNFARSVLCENKGIDVLSRANLTFGVEMFAGIGVEAGVFAVKIGAFGVIEVGDTLACLYMKDSEEGILDGDVKVGNRIGVTGTVGLKFALKVAFLSYTKVLASASYGIDHPIGDWEQINEYWDNVLKSGGREYGVTTLSEELMLLQAEEQTIEERNYLENFDRAWVGGMVGGTQSTYENRLDSILTNAYPYAEPMYNEDGSIIVYLSDSDSSEIEDTLASYAVADNGSYKNMHGIAPVTYVTDELDNETNQPGQDGKLDEIYNENGVVIYPQRKTARTGYGDSNLKIAGDKDFSVATWIRAQNDIHMEAGEQASYEDVSLMLNGSEIYSSVWTGDKWNTVRLTNNSFPDMEPEVAVTDKYAMVTWRNVQSSNTENPIDFNVCDTILAKIYDKEKDTWSDTFTLYNGSTGSVSGLKAEMMKDGTSIVAYTIKTGDDDEIATDTEIMYCVVSSDGTVKNCVRITNDNLRDSNLQLTKLNWNGEERFILGWYNEKQNENETEKDIRMQAVDAEGRPCDDFIENIKQAGAANVSENFRFSVPKGEATINDLSIVWVETKEPEETKNEDSNSEQMMIPKTMYTLSAIRFYQEDNNIYVSLPVEMAKMGSGDTIDSFEPYSNGDDVYAVVQSTHYEINKNDPSTYTVDQLEHIEDAEDGSEPKKELLNVYIPVGVTNLYTAVGKFKLSSINAVEPTIDKYDIQRGFALEVPFTVTNSGVRKIEKVSINLDGKTTDYDVTLLPGESRPLNISYNVPEDIVKDINYSIKAYAAGTMSDEKDCCGTLHLNLPEITLEDVKVSAEIRKERAIQLDIYNSGYVPLENGGKKVVLSLYDTNPDVKTLSGENIDIEPVKTITISDDEDLALMDAGFYSYQFKLNEVEVSQLLEEQFTKEQLKESGYEIPKSGIELYARAWVENEDGSLMTEEDESDNMGTVKMQSLIDKYQCKENIDTRIEKTDSSVDVVVNVKNNSYVDITSGNIVAVLQDSKGNIISKANQSYDPEKADCGLVSVAQEDEQVIKIHFTDNDLLQGYSMEDVFTAVAQYADIDKASKSTNLSEFMISGQPIDIESFKESSEVKVVVQKNKKIAINGEEQVKDVTVRRKDYNLNKTINKNALVGKISVMPENPSNEVRIELNGKVISDSKGAQINAISLNSESNQVLAVVDSPIYKQMKVVRIIPDQTGTNRTYRTEYYDLDDKERAITSDGEVVDLAAEDIQKSEIVYVQDESRYSVILESESDFDSAGMIVGSSESTQDDKQNVSKKVTQMYLKSQATKNTCKLTWNAMKSADGYLVYGRKYTSGKNSQKLKLLKVINNPKTTSYTHKKLEKEKWYEYMVVGFKIVKGKREEIGRSYKVYSLTADKISKYANTKTVQVNKAKITLKSGKTEKIQAKELLPKGKKKKRVIKKLRYISSNKSIATVSATGKVKGINSGDCVVYVIAQNGVRKKVKVVVK